MGDDVQSTATMLYLSYIQNMISKNLVLFLADDDKDDCLFFKDALDELPISAHLTTVHNGEQLMQLLTEGTGELPHAIFLDLNMPRKNGFEVLTELKLNEKLKQLPVIIFSTSYEQDVVNLLHKKGGLYYIRKPAEFSQLKNVIHEALTLISEGHLSQPPIESFVLTGHGAIAV
jgi:CheY-like chemotaxis protein